MKRKILEITEIDCGDKYCGRCEHLSSRGVRCIHFDSPVFWDKDGSIRIHECLGAERRYNEQTFHCSNMRQREKT
jgi:hypothetical protein